MITKAMIKRFKWNMEHYGVDEAFEFLVGETKETRIDEATKFLRKQGYKVTKK